MPPYVGQEITFWKVSGIAKTHKGDFTVKLEKPDYFKYVTVSYEEVGKIELGMELGVSSEGLVRPLRAQITTKTEVEL